jgi:CubicO group peptidase (beta-lactamase class C family)
MFNRLTALVFAVAIVISLGGRGAAAEAPARPDHARDFAAFAARLAADPSAPPGFAVVVTDGRRTLYSRAAGVADAATGRAMGLDTPVYTASTTKAYVGLLAARLDLEGRLPLSTMLTEVWPELATSVSPDFSQVTAASLLSHTSGIWDPGLNWSSNAAGGVGPDEVRRHLAAYAKPVDHGFHYSNLGPFIYSMMVQARIGHDWRKELKAEVFEPLGLRHTAIVLEALDARHIAHCNTRLAGEWREVPLKPTPLLNAGGGVYTSAHDAARFLDAFMAPGPARGVPAAALARTQAQVAAQTVDFFGFKRDGYGLGWDLSAYDGMRVVSRSGGYTGCRSLFAFAPDKSIGVVVLSVGDAGSNLFNVLMAQQAFDQWSQPAVAGARAAERLENFSRMAGAALKEADRQPVPDLTPLSDLGPMRAYEGTYSDGGRLGAFRVSAGGPGLVASMGLFIVDLKPAGGDSFLGYVRDDLATALSFRFERASDGRITVMNWDDRVFRRVEEGGSRS